jgi:hypothetical protein
MIRIGLLLFLFFWLCTGTIHPLEKDWVELLILLAVLLLIPLAVQRSGLWSALWERIGFTLAGFSYALAYMLAPGLVAGLLILPWLFFSLWLLGKVWQHYLCSPRHLADRVQLAAYVYFPVAPLAALSDRLAWAPLGFDPTIILLTAAHFHYAGFILPWIMERVLRHSSPSRGLNGVAGAILLGIPATAIGIVFTQISQGAHYLEALAASIMAFGGLGLASWHFRLALDKAWGFWRRVGMFGLALCLSAAMLLAFLYAWRAYFPLDLLSIPWMYALHGSLNTLGVGVLGVWVWSSLGTNFEQLAHNHGRSAP